MNVLAPITLFVYNRPIHIRRTVEALRKNALAIDSKLIIFSDAPKSKVQARAVNEVREYIRQIDGFKSVSIIERETNFGLARSIIEGVTSVLNEHGRIIVLEDDLVVTSHFLEFMNKGLMQYEKNQQVMQISGYMFPIKLEIEEDALFLPLTTSWGWATWKRAWQVFDLEAKGYALLKSDSVLRKRFNLGGAFDYFSMLEAQLGGRVDSWAVRWQLSAFLNDALVLYPRHSLIINSGFDGSGTNGTMLGDLSKSGAIDEFSPERFPLVKISSEAWCEICDMLRNRCSIWHRLKAKMRLYVTRTLFPESASR